MDGDMSDVKLTKAEWRALEAVDAGRVWRMYRPEGSVLKAQGISSATLWRLAERGYFKDAYNSGSHAVQVLTPAGRAALAGATP
jgi:hypothetical protein